MKVLLENVSENREKWLAIRSSTIGSSEIPTVVGLNKWQTPLQLWMEKTGRAAPKEDNDAMRLGRLLESFIGEKFARDNNKHVAAANVLLSHPVHEAFTASPDFWVLETDFADGATPVGLVECKNVNYRRADEWRDGNCPDHAQLQLQWQLAITGLSGGYVAGLIGAQVYDFYNPYFEADSGIANTLFEAADKFLQLVKSDTPPAAVAADREHIEKSMEPSKEVISLPDTALSLLQRYEDVILERKSRESAVKLVKSEEDTLRAQLELLIGSAGVGECGLYTVEVKRINKPPYTTKPSSYIGFTVKKEGKSL